MTTVSMLPLSSAALEAGLYLEQASSDGGPSPLLDLETTYHLLGNRDDEDGAMLAPVAGMETLTLRAGQAFLGELPLRTARWEKDRLSWVQEAAGHFSAGNLFFMNGAGELQGTISVGASAAETVTVDVAGHVAKPIVYDTKITKSVYPQGHDPAAVPQGDWETGRKLEIGYRPDESRGLVKQVIQLEDRNGEMQELPGAMVLLANDTYQVLITVSADECSAVDDPGFYAQAQLSFDAMKHSPPGTGMVRASCGNVAAAASEQVRLWTARPRTADASADYYAAMPDDRAPIAGLAAVVVADQDFAAAPSGLSLAELRTLLPPGDMTGVDRSTQQLIDSALQRNMRWAMGQKSPEKEWLENFMAQRPPTLSTEQQSLAEKSADWYRRFSCAYLTTSFNQYKGSGEPETRLTEQQEKKLKAYFSTGIAKEKDFTIQHQGLYLEAYLDQVPRLKEYINDNGSRWAEMLHKDLTTGSQFVMLVNSYANDTSRAQALKITKRYALILLALEPGGRVANAYTTSVITGTIGKLTMNVGHRATSIIRTWLPETLRIILKKIENGQIREIEGVTKVAVREAYRHFDENLNGVTDGAAEYMAANAGSSLLDQSRKIERNIGDFLARHPKIAGFGKWLGKVFSLGSWCGGIVSACLSLSGDNWNKMNDVQRADVIAHAVGTTVGTPKALSSFFGLMVKFSLRKLGEFSEWLVAGSLHDAIEWMLSKIIGAVDWVAKCGRNLKNLLGVGKPLAKGTIFETLFAKGWAVGALRLLGLAVSVALTVLSFMQLLKSIKAGDTTDIVWNSVDFAVALATTACIAAGLIFSSAFIPIIGAIIAIIGVVAMVIRWFTTKPKNPVEEFMKKYGVPFADEQPAPPAKKTPVAQYGLFPSPGPVYA